MRHGAALFGFRSADFSPQRGPAAIGGFGLLATGVFVNPPLRRAEMLLLSEKLVHAPHFQVISKQKWGRAVPTPRQNGQLLALLQSGQDL